MNENQGDASIFSTLGKVTKPKAIAKPLPPAPSLPDMETGITAQELEKLQREYLWTCPDCWTVI